MGGHLDLVDFDDRTDIITSTRLHLSRGIFSRAANLPVLCAHNTQLIRILLYSVQTYTHTNIYM